MTQLQGILRKGKKPKQPRESISFDATTRMSKTGGVRFGDSVLSDQFKQLDRTSMMNLHTTMILKKRMSKDILGSSDHSVSSHEGSPRVGVKFADHFDTKRISMMRRSIAEEMFYNEEEIAEFRYEKFMEECGLDPDEYE